MKKLSKPDYILIVIAIALFVYSGLRAATISMTHDESSTYLNYINQTVWECFYLAGCWGTANLHMLNTFFMQIFVEIFGPHPFFVRLPNVLAHGLYLFFSFKLVRQITDKWIMSLAGFLILNAHPYLIDFFSVGRGYGLACAFTMMSIYFLYQLIQNPQHWQSSIWCLLGAFLAILSNFTFLNYFAILSASIGFWTLFLHNENSKYRWFPLILNSGIAIILALLLYKPITFLKGGGEFGYGVDSLWITFNQLVKDDLYGQGYFGGNTNTIFFWIGVILVGMSIIWGALVGGLNIKNRDFHFLFMASFMWIVLIIALIVQHELLDTQYLHRRTALIFFPLTAISVFLLIKTLGDRFSAPSMGLAIVISAFAFLHLARTANLLVCREWYYDAHTYEMLKYIEQKTPKGEEIHLGTYWLFSHTSNFYRETQDLDFMKYVEYEREIRKDSLYDYYYVEPNHGEILHSDYELDRRFGWAAKLYKRKGMP